MLETIQFCFQYLLNHQKHIFRFFLMIFVVERKKDAAANVIYVEFLGKEEKDAIVPFQRQIVKGAICRFQTFSKKDY
jgi:hypothetical protein